MVLLSLLTPLFSRCYHFEISRHVAESVQGSYLLRNSASNPGEFTFSVSEVKVIFIVPMNTSQNPQVVHTQARYVSSCAQVVARGCTSRCKYVRKGSKFLRPNSSGVVSGLGHFL